MSIQKSSQEKIAVRKIAWRIIPLFTLSYFFASLDRVNVGFAALQMNGDIHLSTAAFGFGAGLFFVAYCLFAAPSNMLMIKFGATRWIAVLMIAWGIISACMAAVQGPLSFYTLRFLLGIAEAGYFPGVIYYFTLCFPKKYRGRMVAILMMALPISSVLGSPLSALLLNADGIMGLRGWHWLFIVEGLPAILLGLVTIVILPEKINQAKFLTTEERDCITEEISREHKTSINHTEKTNLFVILFHPRVLLLTLIYLGGTSITNGLALWQPQLIKGFNLTTIQIGMLNSIPFAIASVAMYLWSQHSDKVAERRMHVVIPLVTGVLGLTASMYAWQLWPVIIILCIVISAGSMIKAPFWAMATELIPARTSAISIAQINALNNLGVFVSTWLIGIIRANTGSFTYALTPLLLLAFFACIAALYTGKSTQQQSRQ